MRSVFSYGKVIKELEEKWPLIGKLIRDSYEFHIDFGGHPNFSSIVSGIKEIETSKTFDCSLIHKQSENSYPLALEKTAQAGIETIEFSESLFPRNLNWQI
ncbi:MAG: hypothetical protein KDD50_05090 [Bdellovibrionales bacterium]|nr:hypothetical protein [Bdellovibrionales bacterium]MCB0413684.1 hypothetical protein [Bdellovibrionales bacterium]